MKHFLRKIAFRCVALGLMLVATITLSAESNDTIFYEPFDSQEAFDKWTVINVDETSTTTWSYYRGVARLLKDMSTPRKPQDDWLISPAIPLDASKNYQLSCYVKSGVFNAKENIKITLGTDVTAESQNDELLDIQNLTRADSRTFRTNFSVKSSGNFHLGFYAYSEANQGRIEIDSVAVVEVAAALSPAPVTNLVARAGANGALNAAISFTNPSLTANGQSLTSLSSVNIYRQDSLIGTILNPEPGTDTTFIDSAAVQGYNIYKVIAVSDGNESEARTAQVYVGEDVPAAVGSLVGRLTSSGNIKLTWQEPVATLNGGYLNKPQLKYAIVLGADTIASTSARDYTYTVGQQPQKVYQFRVIPSVGLGTGKDTLSNRVIAGEPLLPPYSESFANGTTTNAPWCQDDTQADFAWSTAKGTSTNLRKDYDGNGGMLLGSAYYASDGESSRVMSPLFNLSKCSNPVLSFYLYRNKREDVDIFGPTNDSLSVQVSLDGGDWATVNEGRFAIFGDANGWVKCEVPLQKYDGKTVQFALLATLAQTKASHRYIYVDSIAVSEAGFNHDLAVRSFTSTSKRVSIGEDTRFSLEVLNRGASTVSDYQVVLKRNGMAVDSISGKKVRPTETVGYEFTVKANLNDSRQEKSEWDAEVEYKDDEVAANNKTQQIAWSVRKNDVPTPANLSAQVNGTGVALTWDACLSEPAVVVDSVITITDDFEGYTPFIIDSIGAWTVIDGDGASTLATPVIPNDYPHKGEPMAWIVFNTTQSGVITENHFDNVFKSHSGVQYMMCSSNNDYYKANDDWLVSPKLDGRAQTISFFARTPSSASGADWLRVYYSSTDKNPDSFTLLGEEDHLPVWDYWNKDAYTYKLPEGAKYFAIRCVRCNLFCMVDDVTYNAANGSSEGRTLIGYNVYRDGKKLNAEPLANTDYADNEPSMNSEHVYTVTAVYAEGESDYSNEASATVTGIRQPSINSAEGKPVYYTLDGKKVSESYKGVAIVRMADGTIRKVMIR